MKMPPPGQFYSIFAIQSSRKDCSYVRPDDLSGRELRSTTKSTEPLPLHRSTLFSESLLKTVVGATRNVGVGHGDQNFPGTTFFLASISVVLEFLRLPWCFPDMLLSRNDMWQIDASDEADVFRWFNEIIMIQLFQKIEELPVLTGAAGALGLHVVHLTFQLLEG
ncbi:hypothetical protein NC651_007789 [Populus alba x Populus x berolinensis]|nr:hypothetical protein NC651_007789 [Populus alba x Populus x berolinensis]